MMEIFSLMMDAQTVWEMLDFYVPVLLPSVQSVETVHMIMENSVMMPIPLLMMDAQTVSKMLDMIV